MIAEGETLMMKKKAALICAAVLFVGCTAIEENVPQGEEAVPAAVISVETYSEETEVLFEVTEEATTSEEVTETEETTEEVISETISEEFTDSDETVTLSETIAENTDISADNGESCSSDITAIELTFYDITMNAGDSDMPIVTMLPEDASDKSEIWTSSDTSVATVDDLGRITAVGEGECTITVQSAVCPDVSAQVKVRVKAPVTQVTYIDGILIANKTYALPSDYAPGVDPDAQAAFDEMQAAAADEGLNLYISSAYRSYDYQKGLYERYVKRSGKAEADRYSARPGHSEHQTGLAFDLNTIDDSFADTDEYIWLKEHCAEYGFIIRYTEDGEAKTGYMYEPWHIRYLGRDVAVKVHDSGLTLEEYLGIDSKYDE